MAGNAPKRGRARPDIAGSPSLIWNSPCRPLERDAMTMTLHVRQEPRRPTGRRCWFLSGHGQRNNRYLSGAHMHRKSRIVAAAALAVGGLVLHGTTWAQDQRVELTGSSI